MVKKLLIPPCTHKGAIIKPLSKVQKIWEHTLPFEKLVVKSTSLSNLMVNGSFLARFFLFCWSAVDIEFANPKLCINEKKKR